MKLALITSLFLITIESLASTRVAAKSEAKLPERAAAGTMIRVEVTTEAPVPEGKNWVLAGNHNGFTVADGLVLTSPAFQGNDGGFGKFFLEAVLVSSGDARLGDFEIITAEGDFLVSVKGTALGNVGSLLTKEEKPVWTLPPLAYGGVNWWILGPLLAICFGAAAWAARVFWKRLRRAQEENLNPRDKALLRLSRATGQVKGGPIPAEVGKRIGFELTGLVREYSAHRFGLDAIESTDSEFLQQLSQQDVTDTHRQRLRQMFHDLNDVRYGHASLESANVPEMARAVREFLHSTWLEEPKR